MKNEKKTSLSTLAWLHKMSFNFFSMDLSPFFASNSRNNESFGDLYSEIRNQSEIRSSIARRPTFPVFVSGTDPFKFYQESRDFFNNFREFIINHEIPLLYDQIWENDMNENDAMEFIYFLDLVEKGADNECISKTHPNFLENRFLVDNAFEMSVYAGNVKLLKYLLEEHGADLGIVLKPRHFLSALVMEHKAMVDLMLEVHGKILENHMDSVMEAAQIILLTKFPDENILTGKLKLQKLSAKAQPGILILAALTRKIEILKTLFSKLVQNAILPHKEIFEVADRLDDKSLILALFNLPGLELEYFVDTKYLSDEMLLSNFLAKMNLGDELWQKLMNQGQKSMEAVKIILQKIPSLRPDNILKNAFIVRRLDIFEYVLESIKKETSNLDDNSLNSLLVSICDENNSSSFVKVLLRDSRCDPFFHESAAILRSSEIGDVETVAALLSHSKVDPVVMKDALKSAVKNGHLRVAALLQSLDKFQFHTVSPCDQAIRDAINNDDHEMLELLLRDKDVDLGYLYSESLRLACKNGNLKIISLLLDYDGSKPVDPLAGNILKNALKQKSLDVAYLLTNKVHDKSKLSGLSEYQKVKHKLYNYKFNRSLVDDESSSNQIIKSRHEKGIFLANITLPEIKLSSSSHNNSMNLNFDGGNLNSVIENDASLGLFVVYPTNNTKSNCQIVNVTLASGTGFFSLLTVILGIFIWHKYGWGFCRFKRSPRYQSEIDTGTPVESIIAAESSPITFEDELSMSYHQYRHFNYPSQEE